MKIKIRKSWGTMSPATKVVPDKTKYKRRARNGNDVWAERQNWIRAHGYSHFLD